MTPGVRPYARRQLRAYASARVVARREHEPSRRFATVGARWRDGRCYRKSIGPCALDRSPPWSVGARMRMEHGWPPLPLPVPDPDISVISTKASTGLGRLRRRRRVGLPRCCAPVAPVAMPPDRLSKRLWQQHALGPCCKKGKGTPRRVLTAIHVRYAATRIGGAIARIHFFTPYIRYTKTSNTALV